MITILRGDAEQLQSECVSFETRQRQGHCLQLLPNSARAWHGLRQLMAFLRQLDSSGEHFDRVVARHRVAVSLIPGELAASGPQDRLLAARPTSHLSHNFLIQGPLFRRLAECIHELTHGMDLTLVVPDLARLDRESLGLLRTLYRRFPDSAPSLLLGFDAERATPDADANGLIWQHPADDVWKVALGFMAVPETVVRDLDRPRRSVPRPPGPDISSWSLEISAEDPAIDSRAFACLAEPQEVDAAATELVVDAMAATFAAFAFTTTLRLGLALLARSPDLTARQAAEVHSHLALSAHNRQFRSRGNIRLAEFLEFHLKRAFETETRAARRSAIAYRLAVTHGRRMKNIEGGLLWSERAIQEARDADIPAEAANLEAWGRNIRAFMLTVQNRLDLAAAECEAAFHGLGAILEAAPEALRAPDACLREVAFSRSLLADNLAAIAQMDDDPERLEAWKGIADQLVEVVPELVRYEARHWITLYRDKLLLDAAVAKARSGLEAARAGQDALREYRYTVEQADLEYRRGDAAAAAAGFEDAERLRRRLGEPEFLKPTRLSAAAAAARAGQLDRARDLLLQALDRLGAEDRDARAQLLACLGCWLARHGEAEAAEDRIDQAITSAVDSGERDTLLNVAVAAGRACQHLRRQADAADAYARALSIANATLEAASVSPCPAAVELAAHLGAWETAVDDPQPAHAERCLELLPAALADAETWWRLDRIRNLVTSCKQRGVDLGQDPRHAAALGNLRTATSQRIDLPG